MNKYYRLFICGLLGLMLMATGTFAVAAPQNRSQDRNAFKNHTTVQKKRAIRPSVRRDSVQHDSIRHNSRRHQSYRQNTARDALKSGRIVSLAVIRQQVRQSFPGKIVDVRLLEPKKNSRSYIYMVKVLRKDGKLLELKINAANARIVGVKGNK